MMSHPMHGMHHLSHCPPQLIVCFMLCSIALHPAPCAISPAVTTQNKHHLPPRPQPRPILALPGLDWQARREVVDLLHQLKKECTLLVVSHDIREVMGHTTPHHTQLVTSPAAHPPHQLHSLTVCEWPRHLCAPLHTCLAHRVFVHRPTSLALRSTPWWTAHGP